MGLVENKAGSTDVEFRSQKPSSKSYTGRRIWDFPKIRIPYSGVLLMGILLFRVLQ